MPRLTALAAASILMLIAPSLGAIIPVKDWVSPSTAPALSSTSTASSLPEPQLAVSQPARIPHIPVAPDYEDLSYSSLSTSLANYSRQPPIPTITANILKPQSGHALPKPTTTIEVLNSSSQASATAVSTVRPLPAETHATGASLDARSSAHLDEAALSARAESGSKGDADYPKYPKITFNLTDIDGLANATSHVAASSIMLQLEGALIVIPFSELFRDWLANGTVFTAQEAMKNDAIELATLHEKVSAGSSSSDEADAEEDVANYQSEETLPADPAEYLDSADGTAIATTASQTSSP